MADEPYPGSSPPQLQGKRAQVIRITVSDPFCAGNVDVEVDKPDTATGARVTLTSSVASTTIDPAFHDIPDMLPNDIKTFDVALPAGTTETSVTFTATVEQPGHVPHTQTNTVQVDCAAAK